MAVKIACPKCNAQYQLPQSALGKAVKCKSCGAVFKTKAPATGNNALMVPTNPNGQTKAAQQKGGLVVQNQAGNQVTTTGPSASEFAQFGIQGPLKRPPEIFPRYTGRPRQQLPSVIEDPGFGSASAVSSGGELKLEDDSSGDGMESIINNPFLKEANERAEAENSAKQKRKAKRKKIKKQAVQEAKDSRQQVTINLVIQGLLILTGCILAVVFGVEEIFEITEESLAKSVTIIMYCGIGLGVVFLILAISVNYFPVTSAITGLVLFLMYDIVFAIFFPRTLTKYKTWGVRIAVYGGMYKAVTDSRKVKKLTKGKRF
ncbi:MAG: zinc-ribbon domain-containing protein [Planctomycetota bacterium]